MADIKMYKHIDELTDDVVLSFFNGKDDIATVRLEKIANKWRFIGELSSSVFDLDESNLVDEDLVGGWYVQDVYINRQHRGKGFFKTVFKSAMNYMESNKDEYACIVLRAFSENEDVPNEKLVELYGRYGFESVQETEEDGIIMIKY